MTPIATKKAAKNKLNAKFLIDPATAITALNEGGDESLIEPPIFTGEFSGLLRVSVG
jgi:hypothetical protein